MIKDGCPKIQKELLKSLKVGNQNPIWLEFQVSWFKEGTGIFWFSGTFQKKFN